MLSPDMVVPCFPVSMKNRDLSDGLEQCSMDSDSLGLCPVDSRSLW
jgi:hypothetical protein